MRNEQFDIETLKQIRNKLDYIHFIAKSNYQDHPELMDTIESLASVAKTFATSKIEEFDGHVKTNGVQGTIVATLGNSYSRMKQYEKEKENQFPSW
jgi:hypothetical protein